MDFETWNGRERIKKDAIPTVFPQKHPVEVPHKVAEEVDSRCRNCDTVRSEIKKLKQDSFKAEMALKVELQKTNMEIIKLKTKCNDQTTEIAQLKKKIYDREKKINKKLGTEMEDNKTKVIISIFAI